MVLVIIYLIKLSFSTAHVKLTTHSPTSSTKSASRWVDQCSNHTSLPTPNFLQEGQLLQCHLDWNNSSQTPKFSCVVISVWRSQVSRWISNLVILDMVIRVVFTSKEGKVTTCMMLLIIFGYVLLSFISTFAGLFSGFYWSISLPALTDNFWRW